MSHRDTRARFRDLEKRAQEIRNKIRKKPEKLPIFIEFAGSPKSGKTACIEIIRHFLRRNGFRVLTPAEGASKRTPFDLREDWVSLNAWSLCYAIRYG